jgi:hypothetical protein
MKELILEDGKEEKSLELLLSNKELKFLEQSFVQRIKKIVEIYRERRQMEIGDGSCLGNALLRSNGPEKYYTGENIEIAAVLPSLQTDPEHFVLGGTACCVRNEEGLPMIVKLTDSEEVVYDYRVPPEIAQRIEILQNMLRKLVA